MANINAGRLHTLGFQIVGLIAAFADFNPNYLIILEDIPHEHGHIRRDCITDAVGQARVSFIYIVNANLVAFIVNTEIDHAAVRICKCDDLLIDVIDHLRFIFNALAFILHIQHLHCSLLILYSYFHDFQQSKVKIHFSFTPSCENHFYTDSSPFRTCISARNAGGLFDFLQYRLIFSV